jgi:DNA replication protein DnaC
MIPFIYFGYTLYIINDYNTITTICKNIKYSTLRNEQDEPSGFFISKKFCGYIFEQLNKDSSVNLLYCLCTATQFKELQKKSDSIITKSDKSIDLYTRKGNYYHLHYVKRDLVCTNFIAKSGEHSDSRSNQKDIITNIIEYYNQNNTCVIMISGEPGTGKSIMGVLIAKELNGSLCKTYSPITSGDTLENIYNKANPTKLKPLIILLDEFDIILHSFHENKVELHKDVPTEVYNKITWNNLLDDINMKLYPRLILILTSNLDKEQIEAKYDPSYIREGRVNMYVKL